MDGFEYGSDDSYPLDVSAQGTVLINGAMATPITVLSAGEGVVVFRIGKTGYVTRPMAVMVQCPKRKVWLGTANFPFRCPK